MYIPCYDDKECLPIDRSVDPDLDRYKDTYNGYGGIGDTGGNARGVSELGTGEGRGWGGGAEEGAGVGSGIEEVRTRSLKTLAARLSRD
ncbi:hypothetical protein BaRGS_00004194 [Batillaria attramentaria]|uniref:Uncharacterized protein n=1 Tax=Batillaria attramentaria TaxID=370345 RepID=A0ABD0M092_9CAEN